jgi:hypothetical protein
MRKIYEFLQRSVILVLLYGSIYFAIESVFKGHSSDYRMAVLGGLLGLWIGIINNAFSYETDLILQGIIGIISVTLAEAVFGYQWNIIEQLGI